MSGGFNALLPTILVDVFGPENYASVNGFLYFIRGCGAFMGTPVGGLLLPARASMSGLVARDYTKVIVYDGALLLGSAFSIGLVRVSEVLVCSQLMAGLRQRRERMDVESLIHGPQLKAHTVKILLTNDDLSTHVQSLGA